MVGNANANGIPFLKRYGIPPAIKNSMVLWYDVARQGATNESMAENPILKDLSGNGHDATCSNFAWSGMSGIGGYAADFTVGDVMNVTVIERTYKIIHATTSSESNSWLLQYRLNSLPVKSFSAKVSGLNGQLLSYYYYDGTVRKIINITSDGIYDFPESILANPNELSLGGFYIPNNGQSLNVTIEQLPQYPNALVSDGVDDYCLVEGLPLLNKEDGYTVIAKRKWLQDIVKKCLVSRNTQWLTEDQIDGAFVVECNRGETYSFGNKVSIKTLFNNNDEFVYQTSVSYNGKATIKPGNNEDNNHLCIAAINKGTMWHSSLLLYSFLLFNRTLTDEEIEWVKTNLISIHPNEEYTKDNLFI